MGMSMMRSANIPDHGLLNVGAPRGMFHQKSWRGCRYRQQIGLYGICSVEVNGIRGSSEIPTVTFFCHESPACFQTLIHKLATQFGKDDGPSRPASSRTSPTSPVLLSCLRSSCLRQ